jgi:hypothetical protein
MKKDDKVYLYYDGKSGRKVIGTCLIVRGFAIKVKFIGWADEKEHECWFVQSKDHKWYKKTWWSGYVRDVEKSIHKMFGCSGDYYSAFSEEM